PRKKNVDISVIFLSISKKTFDVVVIATYNAYGDKTQIEFKDIQLKQNINDSVFKFVIPEGADIIQMDE
ncbi:MAG TPA: outer membrane lipoprotein carrier protein LolA, partial [Candidatus Marinimicrobia bacterium]|nr:outer membrane lipoprotein carrier protein LolA [Candidatus Neomarinimicrobiota bacterium]